MIISCVKPFYILQNQSFFQFVPLGYVIFSNRKLQIDGNYIHKMVIKFCLLCGFFALDLQICVNLLYSSYAFPVL